MNLKTFKKNFLNLYLMLNTQFLYQQNAHFILYYLRVVIFSSIHHYIIFMATKVNWSTKV